MTYEVDEVEPADDVVGQRIVALRNLTKAELEREGWDPAEAVIALELGNGIVLYASRDEEGNGPGAMFGCNAERDQCFQLAMAPDADRPLQS